ncbi:MAG TPA: DUF3429 domain-containing protein [Pseudomonadales bacterium]|nr:DUF3429 domain-containing protein [Pseudomonadales bacterium]
MNDVMPHIKMLGFGGLIPFVALLSSLLMLQEDHPWHGIAQQLLIFYTAIIMTFVGALNWGIALVGEHLSQGQRKTLLTYSVVPSLIVWCLLLLPADIYLMTCALLYVACFGIDSRLTLPHMPHEYADMRRKLSFSVAGVLLMSSQLVV